jgi:hypothetical protein
MTAALLALIAWIVAHLTPAPPAMYPATPPAPVVVVDERPVEVVDQAPPVVDPEGPATDSPLCVDDLAVGCWELPD